LLLTGKTEHFLIIDTVTPLCTAHPQHLTPFLTSLLTSTPNISLLATLHTDIPIPTPYTTDTSSRSHPLQTPYLPSPMQTLLYLSTTILTISSLSQTLSRKRARDKSLQPPVFGLAEQREGIIKGLNAGRERVGERGVVVSMEMRRRSGRGVVENFVLIQTSTPNSAIEIVLLDEHPLYAPAMGGGGGESKSKRKR
jgi:elongator complex protein 5